MIPSSLISDLSTLRPDKSSEENLLNARLCYRFLADNARELQLNDGKFICDVVDFQEVLRQIANAARRAQNFIAPAPIVDSDAAGSSPKCISRYHDPSRVYCLECIPAGAPLGVLLVGNRLPTEQEIEHGLEIQRSLTAVSGESGRPPQPHATCPNCLHAAHSGVVCGHSLGETARCLCEAA